jgi:hypothetical protein
MWHATACRQVFTRLLALSRYRRHVCAQRVRSVVAASQRSIHPNIPGLPWWAAVVIATSATAIGFAFDAGSGNKELTHVFAALYAMGCVFAVLAVRQSGIFTAVIQPPLILFCAVPGAYWLFHGDRISGLKDILISCGYPLIERFPLMLFTSATVLVIGVIRWYLEMAARAGTEANAEDGTADTGGWKDRVAAVLAAIWNRDPVEEADEAAPKAPRRAHAVSRAARTAKSVGGARSTRPSASTRSRRTRPPLDDKAEPTVERVRRRRSTPARDVEAAAEPPILPRRRPRPPRDSDLRSQPPRELRRDPHVRTGRPAGRSSRFDPYEPPEPYEPQPRRRPKPEAANSANYTHHPISRVRYRGAGNPHGSSTAESWAYDI